MSKENQKDEWWWDGLAGIFFIILPLIVLAIVQFFQGSTFWELLSSPVWSFGTAILFGQSIVKFIHAAAKSHGNIIIERLIFFVAGSVVLGLVPSLVVLSLILVSQIPQNWLVILQLVLFIFGCFVFLVSRGSESAF